MQFDLSDIQLCIFDLDGTLVNSATDEIPFFFEKLSKKLDKSIAKNFTHYPHRTFASAINNVTPEHRRTELYDLIEKEMNEDRNNHLRSKRKIYESTRKSLYTLFSCYICTTLIPGI